MFLTPAAAERHRNRRGRKTAPRPPHIAAQGGIGESSIAKLGERGASKGVLPETACSVPGKGADPRGEGEFQHFRGVSLPGFFFVSPVWGFNYMEVVFTGDETLSSTPVDIYLLPLIFFPYAQVFRLRGRAPDSVRSRGSVACFRGGLKTKTAGRKASLDQSDCGVHELFCKMGLRLVPVRVCLTTRVCLLVCFIFRSRRPC